MQHHGAADSLVYVVMVEAVTSHSPDHPPSCSYVTHVAGIDDLGPLASPGTLLLIRQITRPEKTAEYPFKGDVCIMIC